MTEPRFDYEKSTWAGGDAEQARRWYEECPENVRARLAQTNAGSPGDIPIGREMTMTIGFAQEWLAWHDRQRAEREANFRGWQIFWSPICNLSSY
jgi:hypothetical protein